MKKVKITLGMEFLLKLIKTLALKGVNGTLIDKSWRTDLSTPQSTVKILRHFASFFDQENLLKRYCKIFFSISKNLQFVPQCKNNRKLVSWTPNSSVTDY